MPRSASTPRLQALLAAALAVFALLLIGGCGSDDSTQSDSTTQSFDKDQLNEPIEVEAGSTFAFVLDSNQTTGYRWALAGTPHADVVTYEGSTYGPKAGAEQQPGAGGQETLSFKAVGPGTVEIHLEYAFLGGEQGDKPEERVDAHVTVR